MRILAFDTSVSGSHIAVLQGETLLAEMREPLRESQASKLIFLIEQALKQASMKYSEMELIAATVGPGSFTGIRIGLAAAQGIALASGKPAIGIGSLEAIAYEAARQHPDQPILAAIPYLRGQKYIQQFSSLKQGFTPISEPELVDSIREPERALYHEQLPNALILARLAAAKMAAGAPYAPLLPLYVTPPAAKVQACASQNRE